MTFASPNGRRWRWLSLALLGLLGLSYLGYVRQGTPPHGGSLMGLLYGALGFFLILLLLAFGWRKRAYRSALGTLDGWLQAHIYLGFLSVAVIVFHAGFRFHDLVATGSFLLLVAVVLSGLVGTLLYTLVPRRLTEVGSNATSEELSDNLNQLAEAMARLASGRSTSFRRIFEQLQKEAWPGILAGWRLLFAGGGREAGEAGLKKLLPQVDPGEREPLRKLLMLSRQHRELHLRLRRQQSYKNLLEVWLFLHLPLAIALLALVAIHVLAAFYYRGF